MTAVSERSAGGVLWRPGTDPGLVEVCLIATRGRRRWQLPKGHLSDGETEAEAACREVREETGCLGEVSADLGEISFWFYSRGGPRSRVRKSVRFYLLRYRSGETCDHDAEVDDAEWMTGAEGIARLTFTSEREVLERALAMIAAAPPAPSAG
jgi:8-oxo-dGTP diphosphatase